MMINMCIGNSSIQLPKASSFVSKEMEKTGQVDYGIKPDVLLKNFKAKNTLTI